MSNQETLAPTWQYQDATSGNGQANSERPLQLPPIAVGRRSQPPGAWAALVQQLPFRAARTGDQLKGDILPVTHRMPAVREPVRRSILPFARSSEWLYQKLDEFRSCVQSAAIQVVGIIPVEECDHCKRGHGPWTECVVLSGPDNTPVCANCMWFGHSDRCSFGPGPRPVRRHRRRRSSSGVARQVTDQSTQTLARQVTNQSTQTLAMAFSTQQTGAADISTNSEGLGDYGDRWLQDMRMTELMLQRDIRAILILYPRGITVEFMQFGHQIIRSYQRLNNLLMRPPNFR
ncbi:hypothetical protein N7540_009865 [Penicillium herquei]|nr:hypothetical protein N7540_009865 [Penicillium herquei]